MRYSAWLQATTASSSPFSPRAFSRGRPGGRGISVGRALRHHRRRHHGFEHRVSPRAERREGCAGSRALEASVQHHLARRGARERASTERELHAAYPLQRGSGALGLRDAGALALDSLRSERGFRAWGHELDGNTTPLEAGIGFAVPRAKSVDYCIGRDAQFPRCIAEFPHLRVHAERLVGEPAQSAAPRPAQDAGRGLRGRAHGRARNARDRRRMAFT